MGKTILLLVLLTIVFGCAEAEKEENPLFEEISEIQSKFAPDKRVAWFQVNATKEDDYYLLNGESNLPEAVETLKSTLNDKGIPIVDSIVMLPHENLNGVTQGVINISVANLRSEPKHSGELATQATLGTPVNILKKEAGWYWVQTPDGYLAWTDSGGIKAFSEMEMDSWQQTEKVMFTKTYGHSYSTEKETQIVSDLVAGNLLKLVEETNTHFHVAYPDERKAYIKKDKAQRYDSWLTNLTMNEEQLVAKAKELMGVPYLWGGTSTKGVDCSGFTKTVFFLNGMIIPRDASQQVHAGVVVDSIKKFDALQKGDLLFFGRKATDSTKEKVVHVGMWIGNDEFIHSSGRVKIGSVNPESENYDAYNVARYLRTKRYLNHPIGYSMLNEKSVFKD